MAAVASIDVDIPGMFPPDFPVPGDRFVIDMNRPPAASEIPQHRIQLHDARALQEASGLATHEFFARHGFVLLAHKTAVTEWNTDPTRQDADNQIAAIYWQEVEAMVREQVLPGAPITMVAQLPSVITRGPDGPDGYALGVHQDYGITADDFQENAAAFAGDEVAANWRAAYEAAAGKRFTSLNFWRPIHMQGPVRHMPLALCDPSTVRDEDLVPTALANLAPTGRNSIQMGLRYHPDQRWYYYPDMTVDEVLVLNQFEIFHDAPDTNRGCFHTAIPLPATPEDAEPRQSCEHRPLVFY